MTTIAYRDGVLAADGRVTLDTLILTDTCKKIRRLSDGSLFALAGEDTIEERLVQWLEDCEDGPPPQGKDFVAILVEAGGCVTTYHGQGDRFLPAYAQPFAAWGSGSDVAYGAMEMGATAQEAVEAACKRNMTTGGTIQVERPGHQEPNEDE